jgi:pimeloyl-ACP methyl ester carboxylesterase
MRNTLRIPILSILFAVVVPLLGASGTDAATPEAGVKVLKRPITFQVRNVNRSGLACPSDGAAYEVSGHLIGPASEIGPGVSVGRGAVTLYLHDASFGEFFWSFSAAPRYDYAAAMARAGHASVVIDRLGYGSSGHPEGNQTCLGSDADIAHQIVGKLRSGEYVVKEGESPRFDRVALAGHSLGALIANVEASSFNDVDGLVAMSYTPQVTRLAFEQFYAGRIVCEAGGAPSMPGGPGGYAYFGETAGDFDTRVFFSADPAVREIATRQRALDPCGDSASIIDALVYDLKSLSRVKVPVLIVCGREDAATPSFACPYLRRRYVGSGDVSLRFIPKAGHALTLERTAPTLRHRVAKWLSGHGF